MQQQNGRPYSQQRFAHPGKSRKKAIDLRTLENYRVNYLRYLDAKGESCKEEKLQKSRKEKRNSLYGINEDSCRKTAGKGLAKKSR